MSDRDLTTTRKQVFGDVETGTECRVCGRNVTDGRSKTCSDYCSDIVSGVMSLLNWSSVRRRILERDDHECQECGFKQEWNDRGFDHLRERVEEQLPPKPEGPPIDAYEEWDEEQIDAYHAEREAWEEQRSELIERYYNIDYGKWNLWPAPERRLEVDHIRPVADGGHPFDPANLRTLCTECHKAKTAAENSERGGRAARPSVEAELFEFVDGGDGA